MGRRVRYNSILVKDQKTDGFLLVPIENGKIQSQGLRLNIESEAIKDWLENGSMPGNRILFVDSNVEGEDQYFIPKACVDMVLDGKAVEFWDIIDNPDYLSYFLYNVKI